MAAHASAARAGRAEELRERRMRKEEMKEAVRDVAHESGGSIGHTTINNHNDFRGSFVMDDRTTKKITEKIEDHQRGRRRYGRGGK